MPDLRQGAQVSADGTGAKRVKTSQEDRNSQEDQQAGMTRIGVFQCV